MRIRGYAYNLILVGIIIYGCLIRMYGLFEPWASGHLGTAGARFGLQALNFVRYGYLVTGFRPIDDAGWVASGAYHLYTHHPPLISILISLSFRLFGIHEWSVRLVPIIFWLAVMILIYYLAYQLWSSRIALLSCGFAAMMPIGAYYGQHANDQGALQMFGLLVAVNFYWLYYSKSQSRYLLGVAGGVLFAMLADWQGFYIIPLLACHHLIYGRSRWNWQFWLLVIASSVLLLLFILYFFSLDGFFQKLLHRISTQALDSDPNQTYTMFQWVWRMGGRMLRGYTILVLGLGAFWSFYQLFNSLKKKRVAEDTSFVLILLGFATMAVVIGRQVAWIHDYWIVVFIPGLALTAGWSIDYLSDSFVRKTGWHRLTWLTVASLLAILAVNAASVTVTRHQNHRNPTTWADFGRTIAQNTEFNDTILTSARTSSQLNYYADRKLLGEVGSLTQFEAALSSCDDNCRYFFAPLGFPTYPENPGASIVELNVVNSQPYHELLACLQARYETNIGDGYLMVRLDSPLNRELLGKAQPTNMSLTDVAKQLGGIPMYCAGRE